MQKALERKAIREFVKANPDVLTDEEDLKDPVPQSSSPPTVVGKQKNPDQFFDVCNEKINALSIKEKEKKPEKLLKKAGGAARKKAKKSKKSKKEALIETVPVTTKD